MKRNYIFNILGLVVLVLGLVSCHEEQDVEPVVGTKDYPTFSVTRDFEGDVITEGDTISYTITLEKMMVDPITFAILEDTSSTVDNHDVTWESVTIDPYSSEATLMVVAEYDGLPEISDESFNFEIGVFGIGDRYLLNPKQEKYTQSLTLKNYNDPTLLSIALSWDIDADIDMVTYRDTLSGAVLEEWGASGATGAMPELDHSIWLSDPVGDYYVSLMNWGEPTFDYSFVLGYPDGTTETITGTFDATKNLTEDIWMAWGDPGYFSYRVLKVSNDGSKFTVTHLNE